MVKFLKYLLRAFRLHKKIHSLFTIKLYPVTGGLSMKKDIILCLIIAFLIGMLCMDSVYSLKIPDIPIPATATPEVKELIEDYIIPVINQGKIQIRISSSAISSTSNIGTGVITFDNEGSTKYLTVSNGTTNYRVGLTAIP